MQKRDAYALRNLPLWKKVAATALLLLPLGFFVDGWVEQIRGTMESEGAAGAALALGEVLAALAAQDAVACWRVVSLGLGAMAVVLAASVWLFSKTSLRWRVKRLLIGIALIALLVNAAVGLTVPYFEVSQMFVGPLGTLAQLMMFFYAGVPLFQMWSYHRLSPAQPGPHRVVLVGGGFGGLYAALELDREIGHDPRVEVVLVDRSNHFLFPPLLPSAAAGTIESPQVTFPFRRILETTNIRFVKATVDRIDPEAKVVHALVGGTENTSDVLDISYDQLVLAPGSVTNTFRTPGAEQHAFFMRQVDDAVAARNQVIECFERAAACRDPAERAALLRFVVVGAGPTGVEVITELHDLIHHVLLRRYPELEASVVDLVLVQSGDRILPGWSEGVVKMAARQIGKLDIRVVLDDRVTEVGANHVVLGSAGRLSTHTCIWCAGVKPPPLLAASGLELDRSGRAVVREDLSAMGYEDVSVLGDAALFVNSKTGKPLPPLGQVAFQQGPHAARNVIRRIEGLPTLPFKYFDFGALVSVGEHYAAVELMGVRIDGFVGWFVWRTLYLGKLIGMSTKLRVVMDWTLDLLIERSISQIGVGRARAVEPAAAAQRDAPVMGRGEVVS